MTTWLSSVLSTNTLPNMSAANPRGASRPELMVVAVDWSYGGGSFTTVPLPPAATNRFPAVSTATALA